jgi:hypothetical protein
MIFALLKVSTVGLPPVLKKISTKDWREGINNYKGIKAAVEANRLEKYLDGQIV